MFLYFGLRMLKEGMESHGGPSEELTEVGSLTALQCLVLLAFFLCFPFIIRSKRKKNENFVEPDTLKGELQLAVRVFDLTGCKHITFK